MPNIVAKVVAMSKNLKTLVKNVKTQTQSQKQKERIWKGGGVQEAWKYQNFDLCRCLQWATPCSNI